MGAIGAISAVMFLQFTYICFLLIGIGGSILGLRIYAKKKLTVGLVLVETAVWFAIIGLGRLLLYLPDPAFRIFVESTEYFGYVCILGGVLVMISTLESAKDTRLDWTLSGAAGGILLSAAIARAWEVQEITPGIFALIPKSVEWISAVALMAVFLIYVLVKCERQMVRNKRRTRDKRRRLYFNTLLVCLSIVVPFGFVLYGIVADPFFVPMSLETKSLLIIIAQGCFCFGFLIVGIAIAFMGASTFLPSLDVLGLYIIDENGVPMFTHKFKARPGEQDEELLSSAMNAMSAFFKEYTGAKSGIQEMCFKDLFFECVYMPARDELKLPTYTCLLLTEGKIKLVSNALDTFVKKFDLQFQDAIRQFKGNQDLFGGVATLVKEAFYFVR